MLTCCFMGTLLTSSKERVQQQHLCGMCLSHQTQQSVAMVLTCCVFWGCPTYKLHGTCSVMAVVCSVFLSLLNPAEHYSSPDLLFHGHPTYKLQGTCSATALACSVFLSCQARQSPAVVLTCIVPAVFQGLTAYLTTLRTLFSASSLFSPCCKTLYSTNPSRACGSTPTSFRGRCPGKTFTSSQAEVGLGGCQCRSGLHLLCFVRGLLFVSVL